MKRASKQNSVLGGRPRIENAASGADSPLPDVPPSIRPVLLATRPPSPPLDPSDTRVTCANCGTKTDHYTCPICAKPVPQPSWRLMDDSSIKTKALQIIALQLAGKSKDEIGELLGIKATTVGYYVYRAGKNGWLTEFNSAKEAIEGNLLHKVVRNIEEFLEARDKEVTLEMLKATVGKEFGPEPGVQTQNQTAISIRIEQPREAQPMRSGTIGGMAVPVVAIEGETT